jgi:hypothetical protein
MGLGLDTVDGHIAALRDVLPIIRAVELT